MTVVVVAAVAIVLNAIAEKVPMGGVGLRAQNDPLGDVGAANLL
jgi:hypothetical protein